MKTPRFLAALLLVTSAPADAAPPIYVSSFDTGVISTVDSGTGGTLSGSFATTPGQSHGILQIGDELLIASWTGTSRISRYDAATGAFLGVFADASSSLDLPVDLRLGPDGFLWVSSQGNGRINRYDLLTGAAQAPFLAASAQLAAPSGFAFSPDGTRFFVTDRFDGEVLEYNVATGAFVQTLADFTGAAFGIEWGPDGQLYVGSGGLRRVSPTAPLATSLVAAGSFSIGVELGLDGDIYFADYGAGALRRYDPDTNTDLGIFASGPALNGANFFHFAPVPEPSSAVLLLGSLGFFGLRRVRK